VRHGADPDSADSGITEAHGLIKVESERAAGILCTVCAPGLDEYPAHGFTRLPWLSFVVLKADGDRLILGNQLDAGNRDRARAADQVVCVELIAFRGDGFRQV
jgi:hypothetical protein